MDQRGERLPGIVLQITGEQASQALLDLSGNPGC
jgi:hypothetical protein